MSSQVNLNMQLVDMQNNNSYQGTQMSQQHAALAEAKSYQGSSPHQNQMLFADNGQISPVSGHSGNNFTDDAKISIASHFPSYISSLGPPYQMGFGNHEIGKIRMSLLNYANIQIQRANSSGSGSAPGSQNPAAYSVNSYRPDLPEHERDEIKRVINKHSGNQIASPRNARGSQITRKTNMNEGTFGPNVQRVLMLTDIRTSPQAQMAMNYPEFGIYWPQGPSTSSNQN